MSQFKYYPPKLQNNLVFIFLLVLFLLFNRFYGEQTWTWFMEHMSLLGFVVGFGFTFYLVVFWGLGIPYILLHKYEKPRWLYKYKIQEIPEKKKRRKPRVPLSKSIKQVLINQFGGTLPFLLGVYFLMIASGYTADVNIPVWWVAVLQLVGLLLIEDLLFFTMHWILHRKWFFKRIHAVHHQYRESIAIATHYVHYVEHIFGNLLPVFAGVVILQPHPFVVMFWILIVVMNALHTHSGFAFPFMSYSVHHDWHHYYVNGSFSAVGIMDQLFGTDKAFNEMRRKHKKAKRETATT